uniref:Uncharacterized protein n=1 Tax=Oryza punctata TaxID=4537 RepID=A0A0E0JI26_ORYPU
MEAIIYHRQAEHFNQLLRCRSVYDFYNVGFDPTEMLRHLRFRIRSQFCMILNSATTARTPHGPVYMLHCPWHFPDYDDIFLAAHNSFVDVIGLVVHVGDIELRRLYLRRTPTRIIVLVNRRLQIIFIRLWDQRLTHELSTTYETDIIFNPDLVSAHEFNGLRQTFEVAPSNISNRVHAPTAEQPDAYQPYVNPYFMRGRSSVELHEIQMEHVF